MRLLVFLAELDLRQGLGVLEDMFWYITYDVTAWTEDSKEWSSLLSQPLPGLVADLECLKERESSNQNLWYIVGAHSPKENNFVQKY